LDWLCGYSVAFGYFVDAYVSTTRLRFSSTQYRTRPRGDLVLPLRQLFAGDAHRRESAMKPVLATEARGVARILGDGVERIARRPWGLTSELPAQGKASGSRCFRWYSSKAIPSRQHTRRVR
jgi:hypothetical protein